MKKESKATFSTLGLGLLLGLALVFAGQACSRPAEQASRATSAKTQYHCPMHPTYVSDKPGDCPICGMRLVRIEGSAAGTSHETPPPAPGTDPRVAGRAAVRLAPERRQLLGVRSEQLREQPLAYTIRTVGRISADERLVHHVHTKFEGYVEHLHVDFTGRLVKKDEPLLSIYSPELVATQQEYLLAVRARKEFASSGVASVAQNGVDLLEAARERFRLWDIRPDEIAELERSGKVRRSLDLHAESAGYVMQKNVSHGMRVMPSDTLFEIADLSHLWVLADVYESDLPSIRLGMAAEVSVPYLPDKSWRGPVTYIAPTVEEKTRTIKVRIEVDNPADALKPDMFADVLLRVELGRGIVVPDSAVIDAGDRKLVFLDRPDGRLEPREVELGARLATGFRLLRGLAEGDRVVTAANFLLDSESSLKAALSSLAAPAQATAPATAPAAGHRH